MVNLLEKSTTIYFRLPDDRGVTYNQLKLLVELGSRPYSYETQARIDAFERKIYEGADDCDFENYMYMEQQLRELKETLRPYGNGVFLRIDHQKEDKNGWLYYYIDKTLSEDEVEYIKGYVRDTLGTNEVIFDVAYYKLDWGMFNGTIE